MRAASLLVLGTLIAACDPGYDYSPVGWQRVSSGESRLELHGLELQMTNPGGLIGSSGLVPEFTARNLTDEPLVFETVRLMTRGQQYDGHFSGAPDPQWRTVSARSAKRIDPFIELGEPLYEALGSEITLELSCRFGSASPQTLEIRLHRR